MKVNFEFSNPVDSAVRLSVYAHHLTNKFISVISD